MKVLLLGEYSGFYYNLKKGLQKLGVDVKLYANGDDWKDIPGADKILFKDMGTNKLVRGFNRILMPELSKGDLKGYDVVQMVHDVLYSPYINSHMVNYLKKSNGSVYVNISGNHRTLYNSWKEGVLSYYTYDDNPEKYSIFNSDKLGDRLYVSSSEYVDSIVDGIIPIMYEYAAGIKDYANRKQTIQLPMDCDDIEYSDNEVKNKLFFYHGLLRPKDKGGAYIKEALEIVKSKYPNDIDICVADVLPLKDYLEVLKKANVIVDQCKEHCWGMNACYAMALGKIVMGGASYNSLKEFNLNKSPIIHIKPQVEQIVKQMEFILENRAFISQWGYNSRKFVEEFHSSEKVAKMYLDVWSNK